MTIEETEAPEKIMTVVEHLDELRTRIIRSLVVFGIAFGVALFYGKQFVVFLEQPAGGISFQALSLEEPLLVYFKISFYAAVALAFPWILWETAQFIGPGLKPNEKKVVAPVVLGGPILFLCGAAFAYYLVLPPMLHFFTSFGQAMSPINQRLDFYISLVTTIMLYMGLCFQLPIILFALSFTGLVNSRMLMKVWRYAIFTAAVVAGIITPDPTAFSTLIVMTALVALYFFSVLLMRIFGR
jgi:sec-independent protein translocase protein TatC